MKLLVEKGRVNLRLLLEMILPSPSAQNPDIGKSASEIKAWIVRDQQALAIPHAPFAPVPFASSLSQPTRPCSLAALPRLLQARGEAQPGGTAQSTQSRNQAQRPLVQCLLRVPPRQRQRVSRSLQRHCGCPPGVVAQDGGGHPRHVPPHPHPHPARAHLTPRASTPTPSASTPTPSALLTAPYTRYWLLKHNHYRADLLACSSTNPGRLPTTPPSAQRLTPSAPASAPAAASRSSWATVTRSAGSAQRP